MADDVVKNKYRAMPKTYKPYEPEYVRLNKDPIVKGTANAARVVPPLSDGKPEPEQTELPETYSSADGELYDEDGNEVELEDGNQIIDNNDFVDFDLYDVQPTDHLRTPEVGEFILMVFDKPIMAGDLETVENKVKDIIYGDDKDYMEVSVSMDDIVVLKRVGIKLGVFIEK